MTAYEAYKKRQNDFMNRCKCHFPGFDEWEEIKIEKTEQSRITHLKCSKCGRIEKSIEYIPIVLDDHLNAKIDSSKENT